MNREWADSAACSETAPNPIPTGRNLVINGKTCLHTKWNFVEQFSPVNLKALPTEISPVCNHLLFVAQNMSSLPEWGHVLFFLKNQFATPSM